MPHSQRASHSRARLRGYWASCKILLGHIRPGVVRLDNQELLARSEVWASRIIAEAKSETPDDDNGWPMALATSLHTFVHIFRLSAVDSPSAAFLKEAGQMMLIHLQEDMQAIIDSQAASERWVVSWLRDLFRANS